jgi:Concanavalin A-like lectin/glucanases superfamily
MESQFCTGSKLSSFVCRGVFIAWLGFSFQPALAAVLTHRYSFDTDAGDSVGGANGTLQGAAFITNGAVVLNGTNSFVRLPNNLFTNKSVSFEVWYADAGINNPNAQVYSFAGPYGAMFYQLSGVGGFAINGDSIPTPNHYPSPPAVGGTNHLIWSLDITNQTAALYVNGILASQNPTSGLTPMSIGSATNDCIGANAQTNSTLNFQGRIFEFRIYDGALTPLEAAVHEAFGPDQLLADPGTLQAVRLAVPTPTGPGALFRAGVFADFSGVTNVNISTQPDMVLSSDNTNVIAIAPDQRLQTVGLGTTDITATWQGFSNTETVAVDVPQDVALIHRYSFNEATNDWVVHDSVGVANGQIFSPGGLTAFTGKGELMMTTVGSYSTIGGYAALPDGIISSLSEVSIEAWVTWTQRSLWPWQRIFDFGNSPGYSSTYFFMTTEANTFVTNNDVARTTISTNGIYSETPRLDWTNILPLDVTSFVAVTYSPVRGIAKFYVNGQPVSSGAATIPLSAIIDTDNWLGRSQYTGDSYFGGRYNEFRIYRGLLSDTDVAADYVAGPDVVGVDYVLHAFPLSNSLAITWGPSATNLVLKTSPVLGADATWSQVPIQPVLLNGRFRVTVPFTNNAAFYRLLPP